MDPVFTQEVTKRSYDIKSNCSKCSKICFSDFSLEFFVEIFFYKH